jgi:hypothetical protein
VLLAAKTPRESAVQVDGWKIERWCLKAGHNLLASRWMAARDFTPDPQMVQIIFGAGRLPDKAGLWVVKEPDVNLGKSERLEMSNISYLPHRRKPSLNKEDGKVSPKPPRPGGTPARENT